MLLPLIILGFVVLFLLWVLVTQIIIPARSGTSLFPAFREDGLAAKVVAERTRVSLLAEENQHLASLTKLLRERQKLEADLAARTDAIEALTAKAEEASQQTNPNQPKE